LNGKTDPLLTVKCIGIPYRQCAAAVCMAFLTYFFDDLLLAVLYYTMIRCTIYLRAPKSWQSHLNLPLGTKQK